MRLDPPAAADALARLSRAYGQLGAVMRMIEADRDCEEILTQLAACTHAINRTGYRLVASGMQRCATAGDEVDGMTSEKLARLLSSLG